MHRDGTPILGWRKRRQRGSISEAGTGMARTRSRRRRRSTRSLHPGPRSVSGRTAGQRQPPCPATGTDRFVGNPAGTATSRNPAQYGTCRRDPLRHARRAGRLEPARPCSRRREPATGVTIPAIGAGDPRAGTYPATQFQPGRTSGRDIAPSGSFTGTAQRGAGDRLEAPAATLGRLGTPRIPRVGQRSPKPSRSSVRQAAGPSATPSPTSGSGMAGNPRLG